jgi:hypothetical protein
MRNLLYKGLDDTTPQARDAAAKAFGTLVGIVGERPVTPYFTKLDSVKQKKVKDHWPEVVPTVAIPAAGAPQPVAADKPPAATSTTTNAAPSTIRTGKSSVAAAGSSAAAGKLKRTEKVDGSPRTAATTTSSSTSTPTRRATTSVVCLCTTVIYCLNL